MAQQAGQRLSRRRKALEEVGAGTARAVTNANTQAGLPPGAQLAPLQRHFSPGNALEMSGFAGIKFPGVEPRALFWVLFWVLGLVLSSVLCSLFCVLGSVLGSVFGSGFCSLFSLLAQLLRGAPELLSACLGLSRTALEFLLERGGASWAAQTSQLGFKPVRDAFLPPWDFLGCFLLVFPASWAELPGETGLCSPGPEDLSAAFRDVKLELGAGWKGCAPDVELCPCSLLDGAGPHPLQGAETKRLLHPIEKSSAGPFPPGFASSHAPVPVWKTWGSGSLNYLGEIFLS